MPDEPLIVTFAEADASQMERLGAKGAKLAEDFQRMSADFPGGEAAVPDGFILSTECWRAWRDAGRRLPDALFSRVRSQLSALGEREGRRFGDTSGARPLVVAVRGGAPVSLPGAISTILNVGLNDAVVAARIRGGLPEGFVLATYLTAIRMYGEVVLGVPYEPFYTALSRHGAEEESGLAVEVLRGLVPVYKAALAKASHPRFGRGFEERLDLQFRNAVEAVLASWMSETAVEARLSRREKVPEEMGTAVVVQSMVFGNWGGGESLSGVLFTRNQRTGATEPVIEWAENVQCDKIVSGKLRGRLRGTADLASGHPRLHARLLVVRDRLETRARRPLDIEFTIEEGRLYILQRRPLRMTWNATVRAMWNLVDEGKTTVQLASLIINNALEQSEKVLREGFADYAVLGRGEPVTDSADSGILAVGTENALDLANRGVDVILLRRRPYGEADVAVNHPRVRGIVRCDGNATGHEAVSAVAYAKPYLINAVDAEGRPLVIADGESLALNPACTLAPFVGKRVFLDGERGIIGTTDAEGFLEDRKSRKKLYLDWEYIREQFEAGGFGDLPYETCLAYHHQWEVELDGYRRMESDLRAGRPVRREALFTALTHYLEQVPPRDRDRTLAMKDVRVEDFDFGPPLRYLGADLGREVMKVLHELMLATTWQTHWLHEAMVRNAIERGETENDVIRDIFLKNRTMSLIRGFEEDGFHVMKTPTVSHIILASNFEYDQDLDAVAVGPGVLDFPEKVALARQFVEYLAEADPDLAARIRVIQGEPPLGQGHARIASIGLSIPNDRFDLACRHLRAFLDRTRDACRTLDAPPEAETFSDLYRLDPAFAAHPRFRIMHREGKEPGSREAVIAFGECSFGQIDAEVYGKEGYEELTREVKRFQRHLAETGRGGLPARPWHYEVDPYRRHSVIAAVGVSFPHEVLCDVLEALKGFLKAETARKGKP